MPRRTSLFDQPSIIDRMRSRGPRRITFSRTRAPVIQEFDAQNAAKTRAAQLQNQQAGLRNQLLQQLLGGEGVFGGLFGGGQGGDFSQPGFPEAGFGQGGLF